MLVRTNTKIIAYPRGANLRIEILDAATDETMTTLDFTAKEGRGFVNMLDFHVRSLEHIKIRGDKGAAENLKGS